MALLEREVGTSEGAGAGERPTVRPRRSLPNGRAVLGGLLMTLAALAAFALGSADEGGPSTPVVVASTDLPPGHVVGPADVQVALVEVPDAVARSAHATIDEVVGRPTLGPVDAGALISRGALGPTGAAPTHPFVTSLAVDVDRALANRIVAGETVAVLATYGSGADAYTTVVVADAIVVDVSSADGDLVSRAETVLTLAVRDRATVLGVVHADRAGEVTIVRTDGSATGQGDRFRPDAEAAP